MLSGSSVVCEIAEDKSLHWYFVEGYMYVLFIWASFSSAAESFISMTNELYEKPVQ